MADPFEILGVEARFDLDMKALAERHRALSGTLHPDRYVGKPATERRLALDRAIHVNAAWRELRDPVKRGEALLRAHGVAVGETAEPKASPALLMEMMEVREELAAARGAKDLERIAAIGDRMRARERSVLRRLAAGFSSAGGETAALDSVLAALGTLRFLHRLFEELDAIEEDLLA